MGAQRSLLCPPPRPFLPGERPEARPRPPAPSLLALPARGEAPEARQCAHLLPSSRPFQSRETPSPRPGRAPTCSLSPGPSCQRRHPRGRAARPPAPFLPTLPVTEDPPRGRATCPPAHRSGGNHHLPPVSPPLPLCSNCRLLWFLLLAKTKDCITISKVLNRYFSPTEHSNAMKSHGGRSSHA